MIDTTVLILNRDDFIISEPDKFIPNAKGLINEPSLSSTKLGFMKCIKNPSKYEKLKYGYLPRLTLIRRSNKMSYTIQLRIEFSAPKILYENNFDELKSSNFYELIAELKDKLKTMGVITCEHKLIEANISSIHYSKNIVLDKYTKCSYILNELKKVNLNQKLDLSSSDYRNYGHAVRYHTNSYEIVFYDKVKDLDRSKISEKRCIEKDNWLQLDLFNKNTKHSQVNILRMEIRLNNKRTILSNLKKINMYIEPTFQNLFNSRISKGILIHYFNLIWDNWHLDCSQDTKPEDLFMEIEKSKHYKPTKILHLIGALNLVDSIGFQGLRNLFSSMSDRTWQRIKSEIMGLELESISNYRLFQTLCCELEKFESVKKSEIFIN